MNVSVIKKKKKGLCQTPSWFVLCVICLSAFRVSLPDPLSTCLKIKRGFILLIFVLPLDP